MKNISGKLPFPAQEFWISITQIILLLSVFVNKYSAIDDELIEKYPEVTVVTTVRQKTDIIFDGGVTTQTETSGSNITYTYYVTKDSTKVDGLSPDMMSSLLQPIAQGKRKLMFKVKTIQDAHILLSSDSSASKYYWIVLKRCGGPSVIFVSVDYNETSVPHTSDFQLDPSVYKTFWITWGVDNNLLQIGSGESSTVLSYRNEDPFPINYMGVTTYNGNCEVGKLQGNTSAQWIFTSENDYNID